MGGGADGAEVDEDDGVRFRQEPGDFRRRLEAEVGGDREEAQDEEGGEEAEAGSLAHL